MPASFPVTITVDASQSLGALPPIWRFFGADEPNYAYMRDGQTLLGELGELAPQQVYFRAHNLLTTGDGTPALKWGSTNAYTEDEHGNPIYDWTILDRIFDAYLANGVRPYVQIGFMPEAMSVNPIPYQHQWTPKARYEEIYTGWAYPPKDYEKWGELSYQWAKHCLERYGSAEVETWYWEAWNEPNIHYWRGTPEEFRKLHDYAIAGIRRAIPNALVGGCDTAGDGGRFFEEFVEHCLRGTNYATGETSTSLDFVSFHSKGAPTFLEGENGEPGHVRMGIANQLRTIDIAFARIASYPELKNTPIVIGESDPDGCAACQGAQLGYRNTTMFSSYTAASFARKYDLAAKHGVNLEGALTWSFEFEDHPLFAGFRALTTGGIDLPVLNVFRMFSKMGDKRIAAQSTATVALDDIMRSGVRGETPDIGVLASCSDDDRTSLLIWHYHDDDLSGADAAIELKVSGLPNGECRLTHYRIDAAHSNAFTVWQGMDSPATPTPEQYEALKAAGKLETLAGAPQTAAVRNGQATLQFSLPRQGVSLIVLG